MPARGSPLSVALPLDANFDIRLQAAHRFWSAIEGRRMIRLRDVHLDMESAAGTVNILRGIDLDVPTGGSTALVGPQNRVLASSFTFGNPKPR